MTMPRLGLTTGVFDLFHVGHLRFLENARHQCDHLVVLVSPDWLVIEKKGLPPVYSEADRLEIINSLKCVDEAHLQSVSLDHSDAIHRIYESLGADLAIVGEEWRNTPRWHKLTPLLEAQGIKIIFSPRTPNISTSTLREQLGSSLSTMTNSVRDNSL